MAGSKLTVEETRMLNELLHEVRALRRDRRELRAALKLAHAAMRSVIAAWNDAEGEDDAVAECARAVGVTGPALAPKARRRKA